MCTVIKVTVHVITNLTAFFIYKPKVMASKVNKAEIE